MPFRPGYAKELFPPGKKLKITVKPGSPFFRLPQPRDRWGRFVPIPRAGRCLCHYTEPPPSKPPRKKRYRRATPWSREQYRDATGRFAIRPERPHWEAEYQAEYLKSWSPVWDLAEGREPLLFPLNGGPPMTLAEAKAASADTPPDPVPEFLKSAAPELFAMPEPPPPDPEYFPHSGLNVSLDELERRGREGRHGRGGGGGGGGSGKNPNYPDNGGKGITLFEVDMELPPRELDAHGQPMPPDIGPMSEQAYREFVDILVANAPGAPPDDPSRTVLTCFDATRIGRVVVRRLHQLTEVYTRCTPDGPVPGVRVNGRLWQDRNARVEVRFDAGDGEVVGWYG